MTESAGGNSESPQAPKPEPKQEPKGQAGGFHRVVKAVNPLIERTKLDFEACRDVVGKLLSDQEVRVQRETQDKLKALAEQALKPHHPIERYRKALPCQANWDDMSGTDQYRVCGECKLFVYDFSGVELPEAMQIVFHRENKEHPTFFKRKDGRFLTSDCPIGAKRGKQTALVIVGVLLVVGIFIVLMMLAPPPRPAVTTATQPPAPVSTETPQAAEVSKGSFSAPVQPDIQAENAGDQAPSSSPTYTGPSTFATPTAHWKTRPVNAPNPQP